MLRRITTAAALAATAVVATAGVASARPGGEAEANKTCGSGYYLQVGHCQPLPGHGPGRLAI